MKITQTRDIRSVNRWEIFRQILLQHPISRMELCARTGLNKATVSTIVKEWMELGLLLEADLGTSSSGRKPVLLQPVTDAGYAIAVDLDVNSAQVVATDLSGERVIAQRRFTIEQHDFPSVCAQLFHTIDEIVAGRPASRYGLIGIGVAIHGVVDLGGTIRFVPQLDWHNIDIRTLLEERYGVAASVDSDGNLAATMQQKVEMRLPNESDADSEDSTTVSNLMLVNISGTISAGLVIDGKVLRGYHGFANAIGHHTVKFDEPAQCHCGRYGCWEQYCSDEAIIAYANTMLAEPIASMDELIDLIRHQDPAAQKALDYFLTHVAIGLTNIIFIFDTQLIAINSQLLNAFPYYLPEVQRRMTLPITHSERVVLARMGAHGAILGAADAAVERFFQDLSLHDAHEGTATA